jgi:hypothetical protein
LGVAHGRHGRLARGIACAVVVLIPLAGERALAQSPAAADAPAAAQQADPQQIRQELDRLRQEFEAIRESYGARLAALEAKLGPAPAVPSAAPPAQAAAAPPVEVPAGAAGAGGPQGPLPVYGNTAASSKIFNPDIAVIGNFVTAAGRNPVEPLPGFDLREAEVSLQAVVDPYARADFFLAATPEGLEVEEGYLTFSSLPGGLLAKVGKMKEQFGKVNTLHSHTMPWADSPLVMRNLLGRPGNEEGMSDAGISVSKLLLNPWFFLEATGEIYRGSTGPFEASKPGNVSWLGRVRGYRDLTEGTNLDVGASFTHGHNDIGEDFTTRLFGVDATFRYRPLRRAIYRRLVGRTELIWSRREQEDGTVPAFGLYVSGEYQFARRWFGGVRYDRSERAFDASLVDKGPSFLLTYWPSEFSQIRGQFRRTRYAEGVTANEALFQFLFSIGAHGAHVF